MTILPWRAARLTRSPRAPPDRRSPSSKRRSAVVSKCTETAHAIAGLDVVCFRMGRGPGFKLRVADHLEKWFDQKSELKETLEDIINSLWERSVILPLLRLRRRGSSGGGNCRTERHSLPEPPVGRSSALEAPREGGLDCASLSAIRGPPSRRPPPRSILLRKHDGEDSRRAGRVGGVFGAELASGVVIVDLPKQLAALVGEAAEVMLLCGSLSGVKASKRRTRRPRVP